MKTIIRINGMSCGGCINSVRRALQHLPLTKVQVDIGCAEVEYDETKVSRQQIVRMINAVGYEVAETEPLLATH